MMKRSIGLQSFSFNKLTMLPFLCQHWEHFDLQWIKQDKMFTTQAGQSFFRDRLSISSSWLKNFEFIVLSEVKLVSYCCNGSTCTALSIAPGMKGLVNHLFPLCGSIDKTLSQMPLKFPQIMINEFMMFSCWLFSSLTLVWAKKNPSFLCAQEA